MEREFCEGCNLQTSISEVSVWTEGPEGFTSQCVHAPANPRELVGQVVGYRRITPIPDWCKLGQKAEEPKEPTNATRESTCDDCPDFFLNDDREGVCGIYCEVVRCECNEWCHPVPRWCPITDPGTMCLDFTAVGGGGYLDILKQAVEDRNKIRIILKHGDPTESRGGSPKIVQLLPGDIIHIEFEKPTGFIHKEWHLHIREDDIASIDVFVPE